MHDVTSPRNDLTAAFLRAEYGYDHVAGRMTKAGRHIGWMSKTGYRYVTINGRHYREHRLIWLREHGEWPSGQLDHADEDKTNNRIENLRDVSGTQNQMNITANRNNTSGFRGVIFHRQHCKYMARIKRHGKQIHLGYHETPEEASAAYLAARTLLLEAS